MPKIGTPAPQSAPSSRMMPVFSAGSPGPFESMIPSGFCARISFAVACAGMVTTLQPRLTSSRAIFRFAPKSQSATVRAAPAFHSRAGCSQLTESTARSIR